MTCKSTSGHDKYHQNQASKKSNDLQKNVRPPHFFRKNQASIKSNDLSKYLRPRQIPVKVDFWRQLYESQVHSNTTNSVKIKHRRRAVAFKSTSGHDKYHQNQASKKSNDLQKFVRPRQIASESSIEEKQWLVKVPPATTNTIESRLLKAALWGPSALKHDK